MPRHTFFTHLGLYTSPAFLGGKACQRLVNAMAMAPVRKGLTIGDEAEGLVDESRRSVADVLVPDASAIEVKQRLVDLGPDLQRHFNMPLEWGGEGPDFLVYRPGDFFKPHVDTVAYRADPHSRSARRRVSVVLFLNGRSRSNRPGGFEGGLLIFYGLLDGAAWTKCGLGLEPEPGLLVAFPSSVVHEVTPTTSGERYTVLTAFHAPVAPVS